MTNDELADLMKEGFAGVHNRLDSLNGRTRKTETGVAELKVQAHQLQNASYVADERLRTVEIQTAVSSATSRKQGLKWGAIASTGLTIILYVVAYFTGFPVPKF